MQRVYEKEGRTGDSANPDLPIKDYDRLTVPEVIRRLDGLSRREALSIHDYERSNRKRKTLMRQLFRKLHVTG